MFRKTALALAAVATLATAAAAIPTEAEARHGVRNHRHHHHVWRHHHHRHAWHRPGVVVRVGAPFYAYAQYCYIKKRWVRTYYGWRLQRIRVCR